MAKTARRVVAIIVAVLVVAGAVWVGVAANARDSVAIYLDGTPFVCETGIAEPYASDEDETVAGIRITNDLDCTLRFHASNASDFAVELTSITIPLAGPTTVNGASVVQLDGDISTVFPLPRDEDQVTGRDAILDLESPLVLEPGESTSFAASLKYSLGSCVSPGGAMIVENAPIATVSALGISGERDGQRGGYAFIGTADSSCDS